MITFVLCLSALIVVTALVVDNLRLRRQLHRELRERAEMAARALGDGMVRIDRHVLPDPEDARWAPKTVAVEYLSMGVSMKDVREEQMLALGVVTVAEDQRVYIRDPNAPSARLLHPSDALKNYATAVWCAYRNRLVRKSLESQ